MTSVSRQDRLVAAMPVVFVLIWSTGFIVARYGMPHAPPMKFLAVRYLLSVACFAVWAFAARAPMPANRTQVKHLAVTGILMHAGYLGGVWAAVKLGMGAGLVALLVGLQPVLTAVWVSSRGGAVSPRQWAGLALGFGGLALVVWQKLGIGEIHGLNFLLALGALLSITAGTLYQKRFLAPCDVRTASLAQLCAAFVVTLPLALLEPEAMNWNGQLAGSMAWSVLALTLGGSSLLYLLIQRGAATAVTSLLYLVPPCTAVMAWLLFGEAITAFTVAGMALTAVGVSLVVRSPPAPRP
ncbi:DMT family transporter [Caenimonas soli]|uniref:DMT family transporter n=1 Tax=Caenimonas soli TaxID=2735555 RepID=UPI001F443FE8|nr:DMT family transporter [Caenimonas soli]NPC56641.1 DMT family transporter [Caenimonas soli]